MKWSRVFTFLHIEHFTVLTSATSFPCEPKAALSIQIPSSIIARKSKVNNETWKPMNLSYETPGMQMTGCETLCSLRWVIPCNGGYHKCWKMYKLVLVVCAIVYRMEVYEGQPSREMNSHDCSYLLWNRTNGQENDPFNNISNPPTLMSDSETRNEITNGEGEMIIEKRTHRTTIVFRVHSGGSDPSLRRHRNPFVSHEDDSFLSR